MSLKFIGDKVFTSVVIKGERRVFSGCNIDELFEKIGVELCK
ncbi:MAG: hypothetical protein ACRCX2_30410 [Paraclostridium sp.]